MPYGIQTSSDEPGEVPAGVPEGREGEGEEPSLATDAGRVASVIGHDETRRTLVFVLELVRLVAAAIAGFFGGSAV